MPEATVLIYFTGAGSHNDIVIKSNSVLKTNYRYLQITSSTAAVHAHSRYFYSADMRFGPLLQF